MTDKIVKNPLDNVWEAARDVESPNPEIQRYESLELALSYKVAYHMTRVIAFGYTFYVTRLHETLSIYDIGGELLFELPNVEYDTADLAVFLMDSRYYTYKLLDKNQAVKWLVKGDFTASFFFFDHGFKTKFFGDMYFDQATLTSWFNPTVLDGQPLNTSVKVYLNRNNTYRIEYHTIDGYKEVKKGKGHFALGLLEVSNHCY